jgi:hypothetical protein
MIMHKRAIFVKGFDGQHCSDCCKVSGKLGFIYAEP